LNLLRFCLVTSNDKRHLQGEVGVAATSKRFSQAVSKGLIFGIKLTKACSERNIMSGEKEKERQRSLHLEWRDYIAIAIASLETTLLPIVVTVLLLIFLVLVLRP
jgi:hypothetical protein